MNDIRNLIDNLDARFEYQEFETSMRPATTSWPVLQRLDRAADGTPADSGEASPSQVVPSQAVAERAAPGPKPGLFRRYAAPEAAAPGQASGDPGRRMTLGDLFAKLERTGR